MNFTELTNWLLENGGPILRYKTVTELAIDQTDYNLEKFRKDLIGSEIVKKWLQLKNLSDPTKFTGLHHSKSSAYENLMNKLVQLGLNSAFASYDDSAQKSLKMLKTLMNNPGVNFNNFLIALLLSFLCRSGYEKHDITRQALDIRFDALKDFVHLKNLDIYVDPTEFPRLPKIRRHDIVNPELYSDGKLRIPTIHDIWAFSGLLNSDFYKNKRELIENIIKRILTKEYQELKEGYGIVVASPTKAYGMGWSVHLPFFQNPNKLDFSEASLKIIKKSTPSKFLQKFYLVSQFQSARKNNWLTNNLKRLESYKTDKGTYTFPKSCLTERNSGYWVTGAYMGLGENRRKKNWAELESTFWMLKIKKAFGEI